MRVYVNNAKVLDIIISSCMALSTQDVCEVFSPDGLFCVDATGLYKCNITDGSIVNQGIFTIDNSNVERTECSMLPVDHFAVPMKQTTYKFISKQKTNKKKKQTIHLIVDKNEEGKTINSYFDGFSEEFNVYL
jgi:hypothetical protein